MDISTIILFTVATVFLYMSKMGAVAVQQDYLDYNPLEEEDPEFLERLHKDGPKKVLADERLYWFALKSVVPVLTLLALAWSAIVYFHEPSGGTVLTTSIAVSGVMLLWNIYSVVRNWRQAHLFKETYPPLADRVKDALDAEEADRS